LPENPDPKAYKFLFDESRRDIDRQERALDELRSRTGIAISAASVVASFLGVAASADGLGQAGSIGLLAFVVAVGLWTFILLPSGDWRFSNDIFDLFEKYIEADQPASMSETYRNLAIFQHNGRVCNDRKIKVRYLAFAAAAVLLMVEVVFLVLDLPR
jgi:hypothetical protein